jgi:hypothetical protein
MSKIRVVDETMPCQQIASALFVMSTPDRKGRSSNSTIESNSSTHISGGIQVSIPRVIDTNGKISAKSAER